MSAQLAAGLREAASPSSTPEHRSYRVAEWGQTNVPAVEVVRNGRLDMFPSVLDKGYFTVRSRGGQLTLQAGGFIGVIPLNDRVTIEVTPRVPLQNLSRILRIAQHIPVEIEDTSRSYEVEPDFYPSLIDLYARALVGYVDDIALRGLFREYVERHEITSFPRGRILLSETAKSLAPKGLRHKLATSWYQRTVDNAPNRCLKYGIWFLSRCRSDLARSQSMKGGRAIIRDLNRAYRTFDGVQLDLRRSFMHDPLVRGVRPITPLRSYYRSALDLGVAVAEQQGISLDRERGELGLPSLVLNMSVAFEDYVRNVLITAAEDEGWSTKVLDGNKKPPRGGEKPLVDGDSGVAANPDIVLARDTGEGRRYSAVLEVKYKPSHRGVDRDDLNQAIAYGVSYGCDQVVIVQPRGERDSEPARLRDLGSVRGLLVRQYVVDLGAESLSAEEAELSTQIATLAPDSVGPPVSDH